MKIPALQGITLDIILISIPCFIYILYQSTTLSLVTQEYRYWLLLPALGIVSAISLSANLKSSQQIPVSIFAVLSYIEPILLFLIAVFVLDNQITTSDYFTYVPIWLSLIVIGIEGILNKNKVR